MANKNTDWAESRQAVTHRERRMGTVRRITIQAAKQAIAHLGIRRFCVLYLRDGRERSSPWFNSRDRAHQAYDILAAKYGQAIIFVD